MAIDTIRIKDLEEVSVNDLDRMWIVVDSAAPDSTNKVKLSAMAAYIGGVSDGKYIPLAGSSEITGSLIPKTNKEHALGSDSFKWLALYAGEIHAADVLSIPQASPAEPELGKLYLYAGNTGSYSQVPSGGGTAEIYDLYIKRGNTQVGPYDLSEQDQTVDISTLFTGYATETWVSNNFNNYTLPTASSSVLGGIKIGTGLLIDNNGVVSVTGQTQGTVTRVDVGISQYNPDSSGVISLPAYPSTPSSVGLGNVTNDAQVKRTEMGAASGVATLGTDGKIPSSQLPSYVDDVLEYASTSAFPSTGESGKIYVALDTNKTYRWSGTGYVEISPSIVIGTTTGTAFDGKSGYDHVTDGDIHVTAALKTAWSAKYDKPSGGIPATDLADAYLPLSAGSSKPLTDDLYFTKTIYGADVQVGRIGSVIDGGIVTYFTNPSSGSGSGTGPGFAIINTPYEKLLFWLGSTDDSLEIYHEGNLTKGVLTTLLESNNGYYVKKSGDTMTGTLNSQSIIPTSNTSYDLGSSSSKWNNIYTRALYAAVAKISDLLSIPTVAPASGSIVSGEAYLYSSTGSYAETPGGGVADVYPLTITKNGSAWLYYNPGTQAESINLVVPTALSDLTADSTHRLVTDTDKATWNAKYTKPSTGIPKTDLASAVQTTLTNADTAYGWGNHASAGYLTSSSLDGYVNEIATGTGNYISGVSKSGKKLTFTYGTLPTAIAWGSVTGKPTTISGYGITDAKIVNGTITLGSSSITPLISFTETDPTVPSWAKASSKPTYTLDEVADGSTRKLSNYVPVSDLSYLSNHPLNIDNAAAKGVNFHYANAGTKPTGSQDGSAFTLAYSSAWVTQMYGDWRTNKFYTRVKTNGTWGDWAELATTKGTVEGLNTSTESDATFTYRAVPSVAVGDVARVTKVKGKTIVWNQLCQTTWFATGSFGGVSWTNNGDGSYTINNATTSVAQKFAYTTARDSWGDHKYYLATSDSSIAIYFNGTTANQGTYTDSRQIVTAQASDTYYPTIRIASGVSFSNKKVYIKIIDLTLMFGKGSEPTSVAEFEALYPEVFYSYNAGELVSNKAESIETIGFNLWDEELLFGYTINDTTGAIATTSNHIISKNPIPVLPNTLYNIYIAPYAGSSGYGVPIYCYDGNMNYLGRLVTTGASPTFTTPANCMYIRFRLLVNEYGTSYANNICINLSDTSRNGTYEPYRKDNLPLNITKLKVDTTNLWDGIYEAGIYDSNGAKIAASNSWRNTNPISVSGGKAYYTNYILFRYYYDAAMNFISYDNSGSYNFTTPANAVYMNIRQSSETAPQFSVWINTPNKRPPLKLNQLLWIPTFTSFTQRSVTITNNNDGTFTLNGTADSSGSITTFRWSGFTVYGGRKYLTVLKRLSGTISVRPYLRLIPTNKGAGTGTYFGATVGTVSSANEGDPYMAFYVVSGTIFTNYKVMPMLIDLTAMYGAGFEPSTPDEFFELVGDSYIPHNTDREVPYFIYPKGMKGTGTVYDEVVGKKAIRRYGCIDLGDCNWSYTSSLWIATELVGLVAERPNGEKPNVICTKYIAATYSELSSIDKCINIIFTGSSAHGRIYIKDSAYTDSTLYFNSIPGTKLYYELATPIEYDLETAVPELIECDVLGTQRRLPEDTASSVQAPFRCDFQYGANPGEIVSDSAYRYLPLAGGTVTGTLEAKGELVIPDHAPYEPEPNKHYLYVNDNGNYYQS